MLPSVAPEPTFASTFPETVACGERAGQADDATTPITSTVGVGVVRRVRAGP